MRLALVPLLALAACAAPARFVPDASRGFVLRETAGHPHHVYLPAGWSPDRKWPVILYLHGGGERGADGIKPTQVGLGPLVWRSERGFPFIVVFPQTATGRFWAYPEMERRALEALDDVVAHLGGDPARVYLTGNSMGGYGTWLIAARNPGRFAALAPICGGVRPPPLVPLPAKARDEITVAKDPYAVVARKLSRTPVWVFHGGSDPLVPPRESRRMVEALRQVGAEVRYTEYPKVGHNAWDRAYAEPELADWLLARHL